MKKKDYFNIGLLILLFFLILAFLMYNNSESIFGSTTDWLTQHVSFAEYFRNLFYETGNLVPNFSLHLNGGVNIWTMSYYGLLSPVILLSYCFPMVSMLDFIQIISVIIIIADIILLYIWLHKHFDSSISFLGTFIFLCAAPIIFHSHRHIMFVDYMPFLILALLGIERYFDSKKSGLLIISTFLIIMTSYFYSVGAICSIVIYGIYYYLKKYDFQLKEFFKEGLKFSIRIIISILLAAILLLPTAYVILNGRIDTNSSISILDTILPNLTTQFTLYDAYSMGLTSIFIVAIILNVVSRKKERKFLSIFFLAISIFPIFNYVLNGGMYLDGKSFIPFLPLAVYMISCSLKDLFSLEFDKRKIILVTVFIGILLLIPNFSKFFLIDLILMIIGILLIKKKILLTIFIMIISIYNTVSQNGEDILINRESILEKDSIYDTISYNGYRTIHNKDILSNINKIYHMKEYRTTGYSSILNKDYQEFVFSTFQNDNSHRNFLMIGENSNIFFHLFMGDKYLVGESTNMIGYQKIEDNLYQNDNVLPLGYARSNVMSVEDFNSLEYPETMEALLKNIVIDKKVSSDFTSSFSKEELDYEIVDYKNIEWIEENRIISKSNGKMNIRINNDMNNKIIILQFYLEDQSCVIGDLQININGIKNKLTCKSWKYYNNNNPFTYVLTDSELDIKFYKGTYAISDMTMYSIDYDSIKNISKEVDEFRIDEEKTKGDKIIGNIDVHESGYFTFSIPYDKGFSIYIDGKKIDYEKVNLAFIGFEIEKGKHHIEVVYHSPLLKEGKILSLISFFAFMLLLVVEKKKRLECR